MTEQIAVDDFLEHFGVRGMKWGKHNASPDEPKSSSSKGGGADGSTDKPKMSRNKKIAIGVGIGAVVAIGAAVALSSMNKNMDLPISDLIKRPSTPKGHDFVTSLNKKVANPTPSQASNSAGAGLTLGPRSSSTPSSGAGLSLGPRSSSSPSPRSMGGMNGAPSMSTMANLINAPAVTFNPKTGRYETH